MSIEYVKRLSERFLPIPSSIVVDIAEALRKNSQLKPKRNAAIIAG